MPTTTDTIHASNISCQGLAQFVDPDVLTFYGTPVEGYAEEMTRRGEDHVYGCEAIGHTGVPHRLQFNTVCADLGRDAARVSIRCFGCDLVGHFDISPAVSADALIAAMAKAHDTPTAR